MRRVEYPHHTPEQLKGYLDDAITILGELDIEPELREAVFTKVVELLAAKQIVVEQVAAPLMTIPGRGPH